MMYLQKLLLFYYYYDYIVCLVINWPIAYKQYIDF